MWKFLYVSHLESSSDWDDNIVIHFRNCWNSCFQYKLFSFTDFYFHFGLVVTIFCLENIVWFCRTVSSYSYLWFVVWLIVSVWNANSQWHPVSDLDSCHTFPTLYSICWKLSFIFFEIRFHKSLLIWF